MDADEIERILADWQERRDRGAPVSPADVLREHPDLVAPLRERFALLARLGQVLGTEGQDPPARLRPMARDRYRDFRPVAEGGMGAVYRAFDGDLNREVAFKVVRGVGGAPPHVPAAATRSEQAPPERTPEEVARDRTRRFLQEAWVTAGLAHPGILPVYELGRTGDGVPYYTMRFVPGRRTLRSAIQECEGAAIDVRLALLEPFLKICDTLEYAHSRGVIHRDLKPENVALGAYGEVVVLDWGIARLSGTADAHAEAWRRAIEDYRVEAGLATVGEALGTPGYMAPEAVSGDAAAVDARSDVYGLGVILFEILTGRLPFDVRDGVHAAERIRTTDAPAAVSLDASVPGPLSDVCAACLSRDPAARPEGPRALATAIRAWQSHTAVDREVEHLLRDGATALAQAQGLRGTPLVEALDRAAMPVLEALRKRPGDPEALRLRELGARLRETAVNERVRRARRRVAAVLLTLVLAGAGIAAAIVTRVVKGERDVAVNSLGRAVRAEQAANERLWDALVAEARSRRRSLDPGRRFGTLAALGKAAALRSTPELRDEALAALALADVERERTITVTGPRLLALAVDPAFRRVAWGDAAGALVVRPLDGASEEIRLVDKGPPVVWTLRFSPDGRHLAARFEGSGRVRVWDVERRTQVFEDADPCIHDAFDFHPRGDRVAVGRPGGRIDVLRLDDGARVASRDAGLQPYRLRFSPDGSRLAVNSIEAARVRVLPLDEGAPERTLAVAPGCRGLSFAPDGQHLLVGCGDERLYVHDLEDAPGGEPQVILRGHRAQVASVEFSHAGDLAISAAWDGTIRVWDPWTGLERVRIPDGGSWVGLSADDRHLVSMDEAGREIRLYRVEAARECRRLPSLGGRLRGCDLSPDGRRLVTSGSYGVHLWDLEEGRALSIDRGNGFGSLLGPDGEIYASGASGICRWEPVAAPPGSAYGRAACYLPPGGPTLEPEQLALSKDGGRLAVALPRRGAARVLATHGEGPVREVRHPGAFSVALTPDGRTLATGTWHGLGVRVWDAGTGAMRAELPCDADWSHVAFDAEGRWLVVADAERLRVFSVADLALAKARGAPPRLDALACHPSLPLVAASDEVGRIHLLTLPSLEPAYVLESEAGTRNTWLAFSADGRRLAAVGASDVGPTVWDLARIRDGLRRLGFELP